jgi:hypothetical protein
MIEKRTMLFDPRKQLIANPFINMTVVKHTQSRVKASSTDFPLWRLVLTTRNFVELIGEGFQSLVSEAKPMSLHIPKEVVNVLIPDLQLASNKSAPSGQSSKSPCQAMSPIVKGEVIDLTGDKPFSSCSSREVIDLVDSDDDDSANGTSYLDIIELTDDSGLEN